LIASRKTKDGGGPEKAQDESRKVRNPYGSGGFLVRFWPVKKNTGLSKIAFINNKKVFLFLLTDGFTLIT
jgi:hypothetical protein